VAAVTADTAEAASTEITAADLCVSSHKSTSESACSGFDPYS
jgi:hypothetical protein